MRFKLAKGWLARSNMLIPNDRISIPNNQSTAYISCIDTHEGRALAHLAVRALRAM